MAGEITNEAKKDLSLVFLEAMPHKDSPLMMLEKGPAMAGEGAQAGTVVRSVSAKDPYYPSL